MSLSITIDIERRNKMKGKTKKYFIGALILLLCLGFLSPPQQVDAQAKSVSRKRAESIALKSAKQTRGKVNFLPTEKKRENGIRVYEVKFYTASRKYEYDIQISNGKIVGYDIELRRGKYSNKRGQISKSRARKLALKRVGVKNKNATFTKTKLGYDDGIRTYEIKFRTSKRKYEVELRANDGKVLSYNMEVRPSKKNTKKVIGEARAKQIALARVPGATNQHIRIKLDYDDDGVKYEGSINYKRVEYEFEIDAYTGRIIDWEIDD